MTNSLYGRRHLCCGVVQSASTNQWKVYTTTKRGVVVGLHHHQEGRSGKVYTTTKRGVVGRFTPTPRGA